MPLPARLGVSLFVLLTVARLASAQPPTPEQQAKAILAGAKTAHASGDSDGATRRFNEVLEKYPKTLAAKHARYNLALLAFKDPGADYAKVVESLTLLHTAWDFPERAEAVYYTAAAFRLIGLKELEKAAADPASAAKHRANALAKFEEARIKYESARDALGKKDAEWEGRCRCDKAEMSIRMNKPKDARLTCEVFAKDPEHAKLKVRPLGLYYLGLACFLDADMKSAGRFLNQLAPFADAAFGLHARYLVGRILHLGGESVEASVYYDAVLADYEKTKPPGTTKVPEYVAGAAFHSASLSCEAGRFADALAQYQKFVIAYPNDPLTPDAQLRIGFCHVQLKAFDAAEKTLQPLADKSPRLADQSLFWLAKARFAMASASKDPAEKHNQAIQQMRTALEKTRQLADQGDPEAKLRRHEMQLEVADSLFATKRYAEAAGMYRQLWVERLIPARAEECLQRYAFAAGAAGEFDHSDELLGEFRKKFSQSVLMPAVLFRHAENGYGRAQAAQKQNPGAPETRQKWESTAGKYMDVATQYPEFERAAHARLGAGICQHQVGNLDATVKTLEGIPAPERTGELALAAYLLADVYMRLATASHEQAVPKLTAAAQWLEGFTVGLKTPQTPAAWFKLGLCHQRLASNHTDVNERKQALNKARDAYAKLVKEFPNDPLAEQAKIETAKVRAIEGDPDGAIAELRTFIQNDTTKNDPAAPLAALQIATLFRQRNNPAEAAKVLAEARPQYEPAMQNDPDRRDWVPLLKYHHGLALLENGKPFEARVIFEQVVPAALGTSIGAEAALRLGQCLWIEGRKSIQTGHKSRGEAGADNSKRNAADQLESRGRVVLSQAADGLLNHASAFRNAMPSAEARARMYYDAAWVHRELATDDVATARKDHLKQNPGGTLARLPPTRHELRANDAYSRLIQEFPEQSLAVDARLELAEWHAERGDHAEAVALLKGALEGEPTDKPMTRDTLERIRIRLGACLFALKEYKEAASQFDAVLTNEKSPRFNECIDRAGESHFATREFEKTVAILSKVQIISGRALLVLGQAQIALKNLEAGQMAFQSLLERHGDGPFAPEARLRLGESLMDQGKFAEAVSVFLVAAAGEGEIANAATLEAARAYATLGKPEQAVPLLQKLIEANPADSSWHKAARDRRDTLRMQP